VWFIFSPDDDIRQKYLARLENFESTHSGGFRRIYPNGNEEQYAKFFDQGTSLCAETAASRARNELSKQQRVEIEAKLRESDVMRKKLSGARFLGGRRVEELRPESPNRSDRKKRVNIFPRRGYFRYAKVCQSVPEHDNCRTTTEEEEELEESCPVVPSATASKQMDAIAELVSIVWVV